MSSSLKTSEPWEQHESYLGRHLDQETKDIMMSKFSPEERIFLLYGLKNFTIGSRATIEFRKQKERGKKKVLGEGASC